jgi:DNA-binding NtrC family response regulator
MTHPVRVLLVEDSGDDAILLTYRIERHDEPIAITRVDTPFALQAALDSGPWDFVIGDYRLALMDGLLALELVRRHSPDLPFILVSNTAGEEIAVDAMAFRRQRLRDEEQARAPAARFPARAARLARAPPGPGRA